MRNLTLFAALVGLGLSLALGASPAAATDQSGAIKLCAKNPQCGLVRGQGGVNFWIDLPGGGTSNVWCPDEGECVCQTCGGTQQRSGRDLGFVIRPLGWGVRSLSEPVEVSAPETMPAPPPPPPEEVE